MSIITKMRRQKAAYWAPTGFDGEGRRTYADPVEISCRWDETAVQYTDARGETRTSTVVAHVDRDVAVGGRMSLGAVVDLASGADPTVVGVEIRQFNKSPNFKATEFLRTAYA